MVNSQCTGRRTDGTSGSIGQGVAKLYNKNSVYTDNLIYKNIIYLTSAIYQYTKLYYNRSYIFKDCSPYL